MDVIDKYNNGEIGGDEAARQLAAIDYKIVDPWRGAEGFHRMEAVRDDRTHPGTFDEVVLEYDLGRLDKALYYQVVRLREERYRGNTRKKG